MKKILMIICLTILTPMTYGQELDYNYLDDVLENPTGEKLTQKLIQMENQVVAEFKIKIAAVMVDGKITKKQAKEFSLQIDRALVSHSKKNIFEKDYKVGIPLTVFRAGNEYFVDINSEQKIRIDLNGTTNSLLTVLNLLNLTQSGQNVVEVVIDKLNNRQLNIAPFTKKVIDACKAQVPKPELFLPTAAYSSNLDTLCINFDRKMWALMKDFFHESVHACDDAQMDQVNAVHENTTCVHEQIKLKHSFGVYFEERAYKDTHDFLLELMDHPLVGEKLVHLLYRAYYTGEDILDLDYVVNRETLIETYQLDARHVEIDRVHQILEEAGLR